MTRDEIARLVRSISDLAAAIRQADPEDKAEVYHQLGLQLTYTPGHQTIHAEINPTPQTPKNDNSPRFQRNHGELVGIRGGSWTNTPRIPAITTDLDLWR
ncbi:hypothetical protein ACIQCG_14850 [Streptomyces noursei]|uniref:hypothetical protein n=1 Tax=Streptomyces noursei TaxID=1971 RepID=UPI003816924A